MTLTPESLRERRDRFRERTLLYLRLGHDRIAAAAYVASGAGEGTGEALDVGTGKGLLALALARQGFRVASVDVDEEEQALAELLAREAGLADRITFERADAVRLPYEDGRFEVVASMDALHHFEDGEAVLRELIRVLRPGGLLLLAEFTEEGFALVERVHAAEGCTHARSALSLEWVSEYLFERRFSLVARDEANLQDRRTFREPAQPSGRRR